MRIISFPVPSPIFTCWDKGEYYLFLIRNVKTAAISNKQAQAIKNEGGKNNTLESFEILIAKNKESSANAAIVIATIFISFSL